MDPLKIKHSHNPLAVYAENPQNVCFDVQEEGEKIILLLRAHLITLVPTIFLVLVLVLAPLFVGPILNLVGVDIFNSLSAKEIPLLVFGWYLFVFGFAFYKFIFWYFNVYMLTNERVVDFDFKGILHKETAYAPLGQIQDVSPKMIGFFGTIFHYGNVYIQTAGEKPEFEFHHVARPDDVAKAILVEVRREAGEPPGKIE